MSQDVVNAMSDLKSNVSFRRSGGGSNGGRSSGNQCTRSDTRGRSWDRFGSQAGAAPTRTPAPSTTGSTACNIGRAMSAAGQSIDGQRGRVGAFGGIIGTAGEITASLSCPRAGITSW
jgi:hypothetical protein